MIKLDNKTIVVVFLMHLGDLMLTTPFLHVLRKNAKNSKIVYVVDKKLADLVSENPNIDEVYPLEKVRGIKSVAQLYKEGRIINEKFSPDLVINLHSNERASFLSWAIGAKETIGASVKAFKYTMTKWIPVERNKNHATQMYIDILRKIGVEDTTDNGLEMQLKPAWQEKVAKFFAEQNIPKNKGYIGFNIGSAVPEKRWPPENFAKVADYVAEKGYTPVFFGGPMDLDMVKETDCLMKHDSIIATGEFSIGELGAALGYCDVLVTNDSGPMHVAVSQKVPLVTLYGPSNPKFYGPYTDDAIILESTKDMDITKNMKEIIREGKYKGLQVITVDEVISGIEKQLNSKK